ncbi:MAG: hypothetical protein N7Q72_07395, partial [Spiroplasma sp. Tabriz.8]|nr:hypothetical protein [Spiroplasma sp. Tabriz.8]
MTTNTVYTEIGKTCILNSLPCCLFVCLFFFFFYLLLFVGMEWVPRCPYNLALVVYQDRAF